MEKFETLNNEQKELVKYWIEKFYKEAIRKQDVYIDAFIEKHLTPEPVIEVGEWYKSPENKFMIFVEEYNPVAKMIIGYGFNSSGSWFNKTKTFYYKLEKATPEEVEQRLIEEADRKGYKPGMKLLSPRTGDLHTTKNYFPPDFSYSYSDGFHFYYMDACVMSNGKWAEIIDEKAELKATIAKLRTELSTLESQL